MDGIVSELYGTEPLQKHRYHQQLAFCDMRYPYPDEHSRFYRGNYPRIDHFDHCYKFFKEWYESQLSFAEEQPSDEFNHMVLHTGIATYLHDVGHGHASHALEGLFGFNHKENGRRIVLSDEISSILEKNDLNPKIVAGIACEDIHPYTDLIHGEVGIDRVVYTKDDAEKTRSYSDPFFLSDSIVKALGLTEDDFFINFIRILNYDDIEMYNIADMIESFITQRSFLIKAVYGHPANGSGVTMYRRCIKEVVESGYADMSMIINSTFPDQFKYLKQVKEPAVNRLVDCLKSSSPFYGIDIYVNEEQLDVAARIKDDEKTRREVEEEISGRLRSIALVDANILPKKVDLQSLKLKIDGEFRSAKELVKNDFEEVDIKVANSTFYVFVDPNVYMEYSSEGRLSVLDDVVKSICGFE